MLLDKVNLQRQVGEILISGVNTSCDEAAFKQLFALHVEKKKLFHDLVNGEVDFEDIVEALEVLIETKNMDSWISEFTPSLDSLCNKYGIRD